MLVPVVQVRKVGMRMHEFAVLMPVTVRFRDRSVVLVPVMLVVDVNVFVRHWRVPMFVIMPLAHVQPDTDRHQQARDSELQAWRFA